MFETLAAFSAEDPASFALKQVAVESPAAGHSSEANNSDGGEDDWSEEDDDDQPGLSSGSSVGAAQSDAPLTPSSPISVESTLPSYAPMQSPPLPHHLLKPVIPTSASTMWSTAPTE